MFKNKEQSQQSMSIKNDTPLPTSNSNPQIKKFSEINIQLSTSESSSLSSSSSSSTSTSCSLSEKQVNPTQSFSTTPTNASSELDVGSEKQTSNQSQFISFLKNPMTVFSSYNSSASLNPSKTTTNNNNMKPQLSIPTLLRPKLTSNQFVSQSAIPLAFSKLSDNETNQANSQNSNNNQHHQDLQPTCTTSSLTTKSQLRFVQPNKQQLLNETRAKRNTTVRKTTEDNFPSETNNKLSEASRKNSEIQSKKDSQQLVNNLNSSLNSNKRRLFAPYSLNINSNSENFSMSNPTPANSNNTKENSTNVQKHQQTIMPPTSFKLFSQLGGFKSNTANTSTTNSENKLRYFSKMPFKANHLKQNTGLLQFI